MILRTVYVQFIFLVSVLQCYSQELRFEHLSSENGLSNNTVRCIFQDKKGFIWIGTEDGLNQFDGYTVTVFKNKISDSASLSDNFISQIYEDKLGRFWIATAAGGLNLFNRETGKFKRYKTKTGDPNSLANNTVVQVFEDSSDKLWVLCTNGKLCLYQPKSDNFKRIELPIFGTVREFPAPLVYEDKQHYFWIAGNNGLCKYSHQTGDIKKYLPQPNSHLEVSNRVRMIIPKTDSVFYVTVDNLLLEFNKVTEAFTIVKNALAEYVAHFQILYIKDDQSCCWIGTYNGGLVKYNKKDESFTRYINEKCNLSSISGNIVNTIWKDRAGSIWVGTYLNGISKCEPIQKFTSYLKNQIVTSFFENEKGIVWIGTQNNSFFMHNTNTNKWLNYQYHRNNPKGLSYNGITSIFEDKQQVLWVGTWEHGLNKASLPNYNTTDIKFDHLLGEESVLSIINDSLHRMWVGTNNAVYLYKPSEKKFIRFSDKPQANNPVGDDGIQGITYDKNGLIWVSKWSGLWCMVLPKNQEPTPENVTYISYNSGSKNSIPMSDDRVLTSCVSKNGVVWIGTYAGGINKLEFSKPNWQLVKCKNYTSDNGLPSNCVFGIQEDEHGILWISTIKGFVSFNPQSETFVEFDKSDGLQGDDFYWRSSFKSHTGAMYFGGSNGYSTFKPEDIKINRIIPPVTFTGFSIFNVPVPAGAKNSPLKTNINYTTEITITYHQAMFSFDYAALNYISAFKNMYKYKMEGFDKDWVNSGSLRRATYTNLDPGTYTFHVIASNNEGVWNKTGASIIITILPPWWKTWWFRILMAITFIALTIGLYSWRIATLKNQKRKLEKKVAEKTMVVVNQKEELEAFNEELTSTNEELYNQRLELEALNEELTSANELLFSQREELETTLHSLKEAQKQIVQSEKMASLGVLASGIAHEINNPLNFISGGVQGLEYYFTENLTKHVENVNPLIEAIKTGVNRASEIVKGLNRFSRQTELTNENCDFHAIINNCLLMLNNQTGNWIEIQKHYTNTPFSVTCNESKLHQAIFNVVSNAIQSISENGTITLSTYIDQKMAYLKVQDTGCGIPEENLNKILDPFFTTKEPGKGTGLGLSISYQIIQDLKGDLTIQSEVGTGTIVIIKLPLSKNQ